MKTKSIKSIILGIVIYLVWLFATYYFFYPAINGHSSGFWFYLLIIVLLPPFLVISIRNSALKISRRGIDFNSDGLQKFPKIIFYVFVAIIVFLLLAAIWGAKLFHAKKYAGILQVEDYVFTEDIDQSSALSKIALMDTNSAIRLGNREIGSLSELVSQYNVSTSYSQLDLNGAPMKVSALDYAGFFKWIGNKANGVPGYVKVDPVGQSAEYVALEAGMKYVPSGYFNTNLDRHIRFCYPTALFGNTHFEVDEEGNPYYVASVYQYRISLFNGKTVKGAIVCDPTTGQCNYYPVSEVPTWVDVVFDGELLTTQYNWGGELGNGFWNSVFGKKGCKRCTTTATSEGDGYIADYGYVAKDGDIWIYTGVTSVNDDASYIGFILVNQRTSDAHFFTIAGADENSAMSAAEGEVQEKRYEASFPSLINVDEQPTYVMVLKDSSGIVKLYSMVNVESYNIVTTAQTLDDCFAKYRKLIGTVVEEPADETGEASGDALEGTTGQESEEKLGELEEKLLNILSIQYVEISGNTYVYIESDDGAIYRQKFADNENLIRLRVGDSMEVRCRKSESGIYQIEEFKDVVAFSEENVQPQDESESETETEETESEKSGENDRETGANQ